MESVAASYDVGGDNHVYSMPGMGIGTTGFIHRASGIDLGGNRGDDRIVCDLDGQRGEIMIGQILGSLGGLAKSYIDSKTAIKLTEAEIKKKQLTGEIDWDLAAIKATENSWKDEWITLLFSIPLILAFCGDWGRQVVADGFAALEVMPQWYQVALGAVVSASVGIRSVSRFFGKK